MDEKKNYHTRDLLVNILTELDAHPKWNENNGLEFTIQKKEFYADVSDTCPFIVIWHTWWGVIDADDPNVNIIKELVNEVNLEHRTVIFHSTDKEANKFGTHSKCEMLFMSEIPSLRDYLASNLLDIVQAKDTLLEKYYTIIEERKEENEKGKERVVVKGFT